jgi:hypothetical protein
MRNASLFVGLIFMRNFITAIILCSSFMLLDCSSSPVKQVITIETKKGNSGNTYTFIHKNKCRIAFRITRPDKKDTSLFLCIPGAFTQLSDYSIDGLYICNGKTGNRDRVNHSIGGAVSIMDGEAMIFPTSKGTLLTDSLIHFIEEKNGSLFQQIQMIVNGEPAKFVDKKLFQRRGIGTLNNGETVIAESVGAITLKTFADDLAGMGVKELLYTDMGAWDEGWYRDANGRIVTMGYDRSQTDKQSNWVILYR